MDLSKLKPAPWEEMHGSTPIADTGDYDPWCNLVGPDGRVIAMFVEMPYAGAGDAEIAQCQKTSLGNEFSPRVSG